MDELLAQFLIEGPELIQEGSEALLALEAYPGDPGLIDRAFRAVHTLKGSVGLFDMPAMGRALHAAEDAMGELRTGRRTVTGPLISALLAVLAQSERWIAALHASGGLTGADDALAQTLMAALGDRPEPSRAASSTPVAWAEALAEKASLEGRGLVAVRYRPAPGSYFAGDDPIALARSTPGLLHLGLDLASAADDQPYDTFVCRLRVDILSSAAVEEVRANFRFVADQVEIEAVAAATAAPSAETGPPDGFVLQSLRIDPKRVDSLAATAADLVAAKTGISALAAAAAAGEDPKAVADSLGARAKALERLVARLHDEVTALRMAPLRPLLRRYPVLARELAVALGKDAELRVDDNGLEADKTVIEGLSDPLTHLVRNAVDHGVETPAERQIAGKPARATIQLTARREGSTLLLQLQDDGRGVDPEVVRQKAAECGLRSTAQLAGLSDGDVLDLVFTPGFSTAETITEVSGRGVGMDAVRTAVERLGGQVRLSSQLGAGACVTLVLPLGVVMSRLLVVRSGAEMFGAPMDQVLETLRLSPDKVSAIRAGQAFDWRGRTTPLVSLGSLVGHDEHRPSGDLLVLVVRCGTGILGVTVDAIADRIDGVLRPLTGLLAATPGVAGSTVLGNGQILIVLDFEGLAP